jgi:hypothetical protein
MAKSPKKKFKVKRNEKMEAIGKLNRIPEGIQFDPMKEGLGGMRIQIDHILTLNGFNEKNLNSIGFALVDFAEHRREFIKVATSIILHDGVRPMRQQARAAMMRLVGVMRIKETARPLLHILNSTHEHPRVRAAAADAIGFVNNKKFEKHLVPHLEDDDETVKESVVVALNKLGTDKSLAALYRLRAKAKRRMLQKALNESIRSIEKRLYGKPKLKKWKPSRRRKQRITVEQRFFINSEGALETK